MSEHYDEDADPSGTGFHRPDGFPVNRLMAMAIAVYVDRMGADVEVGTLAQLFRVPVANIVEAVEKGGGWLFIRGDGPVESRFVAPDGE